MQKEAVNTGVVSAALALKAIVTIFGDMYFLLFFFFIRNVTMYELSHNV